MNTKFMNSYTSNQVARNMMHEWLHKLGFKHAIKMMAQSGFCGFYLAVRTPGTLAAGESYELIPGPREVSIRDLFRAKMQKQAQSD